MAIVRWLREEIKEGFQRQGGAGLVVWYDPGGTLAPVVEQARPKGIRLHPLDGSYLALRLELESQDPDFQGRWLLYIPEAPPDPSWLRDLELLGTRTEMDLLELLHRRAGIPIDDRWKRLLREHPANARELAEAWDRVMSSGRVDAEAVLEALLALAFGLSGPWRMEEALLAFLSSDGWRDRLDRRGLWQEWQTQVRAWTGMSALPAAEEELRKLLQAGVLLAELVRAVPSLRPHWAFLPNEAEPLERLALLAGKWRCREDLRGAYVRAARRVEQAYDLPALLSPDEALLELETFRCIDERWQQELRNAVRPNGENLVEKVERVRTVTGRRKDAFWARQDGELRAFWEALDLSTRLLETCRSATDDLQGSRNLGELQNRYQDGWWRLDLWVLQLAARSERLAEDDRRRFVYPAWRAYRDWLDASARVLAEAVEREGWSPAVPGFWGEASRGRKRTAVFFIDALRYDLAQYLAEQAKDSVPFRVRIRPGMLPSVTEIGMAALLPEAERGIAVTVEGETLGVRIEGQSVSRRDERKAWLRQHLPQHARVVDLDEVEATDWTRVRLAVVLSQEIDAFGTLAADLQPAGLLDMVEKIARAIRFLARQGFERFWAGTDHGFLFIPSGVEPGTVTAPQAVIRTRRFAVGGTVEGAWVCPGRDLGLQSGLLFAFPKGLSVFGLQGPTGAFLHGGLSLQECFVPLLEGETVLQSPQVEVEMEVEEPVTSRIVSVRLRGRRKTLVARSRHVRVQVGDVLGDVVEVPPQGAEVTVTVRWLDEFSEPPSEVTVRLLDADTHQVLAKRVCPVRLLI